MKVYVDKKGTNKSVLVISKGGRLFRLYTPFKVICRLPVNGIKTNTQVYVEEVYGTVRGEIIYVIFKKPFHHSHFEIVIRF